MHRYHFAKTLTSTKREETRNNPCVSQKWVAPWTLFWQAYRVAVSISTPRFLRVSKKSSRNKQVLSMELIKDTNSRSYLPSYAFFKEISMKFRDSKRLKQRLRWMIDATKEKYMSRKYLRLPLNLVLGCRETSREFTDHIGYAEICPSRG